MKWSYLLVAACRHQALHVACPATAKTTQFHVNSPPARGVTCQSGLNICYSGASLEGRAQDSLACTQLSAHVCSMRNQVLFSAQDICSICY